MPDYFWIPLMLGAGFVVGCAFWALIIHIDRKNDLENFWDKLQKLDARLRAVEKVASEQLEATDCKPPVSNKSVSFNVQKPTIFGWIKSFFRQGDNKKTTDEQPKKSSKEFQNEILKVNLRLENLKNDVIRIVVSKKNLEEKLAEAEQQPKENSDRLEQARQEIINAEKRRLEEQRRNTSFWTERKDKAISITKYSDTPSSDTMTPEEVKSKEAAETDSGFQQNKGNRAFNNLSEEIAHSYNLGIENRTARNTFWENYRTIRIGNNKAVEQRLGEADAPEFRILDSGNFIAVKDSVSDAYLVVPQFDMTLTASAYNEGGVGFVFDFDRSDYDQETAYSTIRVLKPAVFHQEGENWVRVEKGVLNLQI